LSIFLSVPFVTALPGYGVTDDDITESYVYDRRTGEFWFVPNSSDGVDGLLAISGEEKNSNPEKSAYAAFQALNIAEWLGYDEGLAEGYLSLGELYERLMDYPQALEEYQSALGVERRLHRDIRIGRALNKIGMVRIQQEEYSDARGYFEQTLNLLGDTGYNLTKAEALSGLGLAHYHSEDYSRALEYFDQVQALGGSGEDLERIKMEAVMNAGNTYAELPEYERAETLLTRAIRYFGEHGDVAEQSEGRLYLAALYRQWGKPGEALGQARRGIELAESVEENSLIMDGYRLLSGIYEDQGNPGQALLNHRRYHNLESRLLDSEREARLTQRQIQHDVAQQNREIRRLNQEAALQEAKMVQQELWQNVMFGGFGLAILIAGLLVRNIQIRKSAHQELQQKQSEIEASLQEKEFLLNEIHHRVKNNFATVSSLLKLQAQSAKDEEMKNVLAESEGRVQSMGMIHEMLYQQEDFSRVDFGAYIKKLLQHISANYETSGLRIKTEVRYDPVNLGISTAVPCALIIHELISNAYKHAFIGRESGKILITLNHTKDTYTLVVSDNGIGLPSKIKSSQLGLMLIHGLTKQIKGIVTSETGNGTTYIIKFPAY
ncbi:MAG: histidine kinase dimerization/phosphoacceptor domain -containing protein, partial [Balneolales bacterium]